MTVQEAIDHLQELVDCNPENANAELRVATQPNWPLQYRIDTITDVIEVEAENTNVVYIAEGSQCSEPYLPKVAKEEIGW